MGKKSMNNLEKEALEQLSEKQLEEMESLLAARAGERPPVHTDDSVRSSAFSELFSGIPVYQDEEER